MKSPPTAVVNWEALLVHAAKMRALDMVRSALTKHASSQDVSDQDTAVLGSLEDDVIEAVDRQRAAGAAWDKLATLDDRSRKVAWEYVAKERPRAEVAREMDVTPARVSQIAKAALESLREALEADGVEP